MLIHPGATFYPFLGVMSSGRLLIAFPLDASIGRRSVMETVPALLPPEDVEGLNFEDLAYPDIA